MIPVVYSYLVESHLLARIATREKKARIPLFTIGKKLNAFTVEKTTIVHGSSVISMNYLRRAKLFFKKLFYGSTAEHVRLIDLAQREAFLNMQESAESAEYIVDIEIKHSRINNGEIEVFVCGTAVHLFPDTLGLYFLPELPPIHDKITQKIDILKNFLINLLIPSLLIACVFIAQKKTETHVINDFTLQDEEVIWDYISTRSDISDRNLPQHLAELEQDLQAYLDIIPKDGEWLSKYQFKAILINSESKEIEIMPSGHILLHKGMLRDIKNENALVFLLANAVQHYKGQNHIKSIGSNLITPYLFLKTMGDDSFITKWIVRIYPFGYASFTKKQNDDSSSAAIDITNDLLGNIGGIISLQTYADSNDYIKNHLSFTFIENYIAKHNLLNGTPIAIDFVIDKTIVADPKPVNVIPQLEEHKNYQEVLAEFNLNTSSMLAKYKESMSFIPGLLDPRSLNSNEAIEFKTEYVDYGKKTIAYYENLLDDTIEKYDNKFLEILDNIEDPDQIRILNSIWVAEVDQINIIADFYFKRDLEILKNQQGALNFLKHRIGQFSTSGGKVNFKLKNDQESYDGIMQRIKNQYSKKPPITNKEKR